MQGIVYVTDGHVFEPDKDGLRMYYELSDYHGGPHCLLCGEYWCEYCDQDIFSEKCTDRLPTLPGLEYPQPPPPPLVVGRRVERTMDADLPTVP